MHRSKPVPLVVNIGMRKPDAALNPLSLHDEKAPSLEYNTCYAPSKIEKMGEDYMENSDSELKY